MHDLEWVRVRQDLDKETVKSPAASTERQLESIAAGIGPLAGRHIAVTVGSRSIANLVEITGAVCDFLKSRGALPFLVPAMGSHGGATSDGQIEILKDFGFTEQSMGVPIRSSMDVVRLGEVEGIPVYFDRHAFEADGTVVINRIKPHQVFRGDIQSGLNKMLAVGLGKQKGADCVHASGRTDILATLGDFIRSRTSILFGVAILENAYDQTREIAVLSPDKFSTFDRDWAKQSRELMPKIPVRSLDLLLVQEMGKDISGSGMDTNVVGFTRRLDASGKAAVPLAVLDLTEKSDGNAIGIGLADFTTRRLVDKIDFTKTHTNVITTGVYSAGRIPITLGSERQIIETILSKLEEPAAAKIIRIKNTLHLEEFYATAALIPAVEKNDRLYILEGPLKTAFDDAGDLALVRAGCKQRK